MDYKEINKNTLQKTVEDDANIQLEIFEDFESIAAMQPKWDAFIESMDGDIFLTYDWCRVWWKHYGNNRKLRIFVFQNNDSIVGIIPIFFETIWLGPVYLRVAKIVGTDFTIAQISWPVQVEFVPPVMEKFFNELNSKYMWDIICLGPFAGQYNDFGFLYHTCRRLLAKRLHVTKVKSGVQTYFELAESWEKYLDGLSGRKKEEFTRTYGLFAKTIGTAAPEICRRIADRNNIDEIFTTFLRMHKIQWNGLGKMGHFGDWPSAEEFHREIAHAQLNHNRLRLLEVSSGDCCLGYEYSFKYGKKYLNFLGARFISEQLERISIGKLTFGEMAKEAISEQINYIDSSQGRYEHKLRLGGKLFPVHKIQITPQNISIQIRVMMFRFFAKLLHICYYRVWFCRIAPRLPFKRKPLWKSWIKSAALA